ncbi:Glutamate/aspartate:proton symporter [Pseudomonas coronafaciens pv. atropurpurea]|nr:Glutamate/aspartate:proton symporter [Pseudomonas coronafaciens pv. atropurpurea]
MKKAKLSLAWQILIGLALGIAVGALLNHFSAEKAWWISNILQPAGDIFIRLIKMIVIPIVVASLIVGIAGVGDAKKLGRIGLKTILYFEVVTTIAILVGLVLANVFHPGTGIDMSTLGTVDISKYQQTTAEVQHDHAFVATILNLIPSNIFAAMARGEMLPIIFFSVLFGLGLSSLQAEVREPLVKLFQGVSETMFKVTHMIMSYAPIGVFALIAVTVANFGFASLLPLAKLVILVYVAIIFFAFVVLGLIAKAFGFSVIKLMRIFQGRADSVLLHRQLGNRPAARDSEDGSLRRTESDLQFRGAHWLFVQPRRLDALSEYCGDIHCPALRHRPVDRCTADAGTDADGHLQGHRGRTGCLLRRVAGDTGQRRYPTGRPGLHRGRRPDHGHGAHGPERDRQRTGGTGDLALGRHV